MADACQVRYNASALEDGVTIREVLDMPVLRDLFIQHCHAAHCEELMEFLAEVQLFKVRRAARQAAGGRRRRRRLRGCWCWCCRRRCCGRTRGLL